MKKSNKNENFSPEEFNGNLINLVNKYPKVFNSQNNERNCVLGIGCLSHDSSVALIHKSSGNVVFAIAEERLSNLKHDSRFPWLGILSAIKIAKEKDYKIQSIAINFNPDLFLPSVIENEVDELSMVPKKNKHLFLEKINKIAQKGKYLELKNKRDTNQETVETLLSNLISHKLKLENTKKNRLLKRLTWYFNVAVKYHSLKKIIFEIFSGTQISFYNHHDCHAATAIHNSAMIRGISIVIDGHGETDTTTIYKFENYSIQRISETSWPVSIGSLYLVITRHLGFDYGDEYKVMGMTAYGKPSMKQYFHDAFKISNNCEILFNETKFLKIKEVDNSGQLRLSVTSDFVKVCPKRNKNEKITQLHYDLAASLQSFVEDIVVRMVKDVVQKTGINNISLAGGVALNGLMNNAIRESCNLDDLFIYPAASDDGTSLGAALMQLQSEKIITNQRLQSCYYGNDIKPENIRQTLNKMNIKFHYKNNINYEIAKQLHNGKIVSRYIGQSEFGPRALGHRSILANPTKKEMKDIINSRIKHREPFRPFAPAVIREYATEYFDLQNEEDAPFMIIIVSAKELAKSLIPAVVHEDGTARVQTVTKEENHDFYQTLLEFQKLSGIPVLINTSFNVNGEAIVEYPIDAIESFLFMDIDYLAIGNYWISKKDIQHEISNLDHKNYLQIRKDRYEKQLSVNYPRINPRKYGSWFYLEAK